MLHDVRFESEENDGLDSFAQNRGKVGLMRSIFLIYLLLVVFLVLPVRVHADVGRIDAQALRAQAAAWLAQQAMTSFPGVSAETEVGEIDTRLRLAACADLRFILPANAPLWGRGSLGVRCETPSPWSFYLSFRNRLTGPALVATRPLVAREAPTGADVELRQIEYAQTPDLYPSVLPKDARLNRPVAAAQPILIGMLSLPNVITAGRPVRLQVQTPSFSVSQEGVALGNAAPGERVRVRTPGGRIVHGIAREDGSVAVRP
jgi:flagellar basal body P-ring formation protein FlgA